MYKKTTIIRTLGVMMICAASLLVAACGSSSAQSNVIPPVATNPAQTQSPTDVTNLVTKPISTGASLSIALNNTQVNLGDSFDVNVIINTSKPSRSAQVSLNFDPSAMQCTGVAEGNFFRDWATSNGLSTMLIPSQAEVDNSKGAVAVLGDLVLGQTQAEQDSGQIGGPQGQGVLFTYHMTANSGAHGSTILTIADGKIADSNGNAFADVTINNGKVTIGTP